MNNNAIKYFEYARKSSEGADRQVLSIEGQLKDNKEVIARNKLNVVATITDTASAATPYNRPGFTDMIRRMKKGEASGIVVWNIDRLARNPVEEGEFKWMLQTGIIKSIWTPNREFRSEDNVLLIGIEASMATQYSLDLSVKVKRSNKLRYEEGHPLGKAPLGYLNSKSQAYGTNYIFEDPERFSVMRMGFQLLLTGLYTIPQVVSFLHEHGLRSRGTKNSKASLVSLSTMYRIFTDEFYAGYFTRAGVRYKGCYKPMITLDEFDRIQHILGRKGKPKPHKHDFAFTGLIRCGSCGCAITASRKLKRLQTTGEYKSYVFYHCSKRKGRPACSERRYTTEYEMNAMVAEELRKTTMHPAFKNWAIDMILKEKSLQEETAKRNELLQSAIAYERKIEQELDSLLDLRIAGEVAESVYMQKRSERESLLYRVRERRQLAERNDDDWQKQLDACLDFASNSAKRFMQGDLFEKKQLCRSLGSNWVLQGKKLTMTRHKWLNYIATLKDHFEGENGGFEPRKTFAEYSNSAAFAIGNSILLGLLDHIRTESQKSPYK